MRIRNLALTALYVSIALVAAAPAFAGDEWSRHERGGWRDHEWRDHEWRDHEWRDHEWRDHDGRVHEWREREPRDHEWRERAWRERNWQDHYYAPPVVVAPGYGDYAPPPVYYANPRYDR